MSRRPRLQKNNKPVLTPREKRFVKKVIQMNEIGKAALAAGYSHKEYGSMLLKKEHIRQAILEKMQEQGITDSYIAQKIKEGLEATYPKKFASNGSIIQENEPDYFTREKYLDKVLKITGAYDNEVKEIHEKREVVIVMTPEMLKGLQDAGVIDAEIIKEETSNGNQEQIRETPETN
ncbi:MAG: terminase small subunit [Candidatus Bathyarchaeia archaeon]